MVGVNPRDIGGRVRWLHAIHLARRFTSDPAYHTGAAVMSMDYPVQRQDLVLRDIFDLLQEGLRFKRKRPYPRPFKGASTSYGKTSLQQSTVRRILAERAAYRTTEN